ncbi:MAG: hypothetical protein MN733_22765, partial [Nitrososphaera sp.]|nr:hypothetical protein [Nitrososphaera sp.]
MRSIVGVLTLLIPWLFRRRVLQALFGFDIHPTAKIGFSFITALRHLTMEAGSSIGHLNFCKGLDHLEIGEEARIGNLNWITGFPLGGQPHFSGENRHPSLVLGAHSAITHRHLIDCTNAVSIGKYTTVAGFRSQILTHSIDLYQCKQSSRPVVIGDYCFVGTSSIVLAGSKLPDYSVLAAGSLLKGNFEETHHL